VTRRTRISIFLVAGAGFAALVFWGLAGLPHFGGYQGGYGNKLNAAAGPDRHATNVVTAIVFDYRGFDTLGEEFILFTAVLGVALLLREQDREERDAPDDSVGSDGVRIFGALLVAPLFLLGLWLIAFAVVTPGGGFQGGVVVAAALLLVYLVTSYRDYSALTPKPLLEVGKGFGAGAYVVLGFVGLAWEGAYLENFLGKGDSGTLFSAGSIPLLNWATAIEVATAMLLLFTEFLEEYLVPIALQRSGK
jgi:multicomponent Na+:H+ antiporter subunit B